MVKLSVFFLTSLFLTGAYATEETSQEEVTSSEEENSLPEDVRQELTSHNISGTQVKEISSKDDLNDNIRCAIFTEKCNYEGMNLYNSNIEFAIFKSNPSENLFSSGKARKDDKERNHSLKGVFCLKGVTETEWHVFSYCQGLESVTLPNGFENIGRYSFSNCVNLKHINIPLTVNSIERGAFQGCISLKEVIIPAKADLEIDIFADSGVKIVRFVGEAEERSDEEKAAFFASLFGGYDKDGNCLISKDQKGAKVIYNGETWIFNGIRFEKAE